MLEKTTRSNMHFSVETLWFFMLLFSVSVTLSPAADTIFPGKSLSGGQTLISRAGNFELGFFKPGNSQNYYVGIWYKKINRRTVVWVANRDKPLTDDTKSMLKISEDGNLVILNQFKLPVWSSNVDSIVRNSIVAVLLDSGNLILRDDSNSSSVLWQSFDHPTDTWLPGAKLGFNKTTGQIISLTSWRNSQDPAPGIFSLGMDSNGISQFRLVWNKTQQYWSSGAWNGHYFSSIMEMAANHLYVFTNVSSVNASYFTYAVLDTQLVSNFMIDTTGQMRRREWLNGTEEWLPFCILPSDPCEVYSLCGSFGSCNTHISPACRCMTGFQPRVARDWELNDWSSGCVRRTPLQCSDINPSSNGEKDRFLEMPNMILPENNQSVEVGSAEECQLICLKNCSCVAYSYSSRCLIWFGDLMDAKELTHVGGSQETSSVLYLRLAASELATSRRRTKITVLVVFVIALMGTIISCFALVLIWRRRRMYMARKSDAFQGILLSFRYKDLQKATKNFSEKLGTGGFGSVFKGTLSDSSVVAVKKLEGLRQGEKQFRMEVRAIGTIQHVNLVPFRGFCAEGTERLLVFEYMPHGSLDSHLFRSSSKILDWSTRYRIALGIARGLAYLHEKCRECIIHCDIKPENILLDAALNPKVADFGLAKLLGREFSHVLTSMRGTIGYLAPEWISGLAITPKADVYSFGMMLLEIISGRRNTEGSEKGKYFPVEAANNLIEGKVLCLLDARLKGNANIDQLNIACRVACWCIQDMESERPTMGLVVQMLEGLINVSVPPVSRFLQGLVLDYHDQSFESEASPDSTYHSTHSDESRGWQSVVSP